MLFVFKLVVLLLQSGPYSLEFNDDLLHVGNLLLTTVYYVPIFLELISEEVVVVLKLVELLVHHFGLLDFDHECSIFAD
jgi:hypothetical protein